MARDRGHRLDVYAPKGAGPFPTLVFLYGGGWTDGDRSIYHFLGDAFASRGFVTIIPDYRLYPEVRFPGFVEDCAKAVAWAHGNAGRWVWGHRGLLRRGALGRRL